MEMNVLETKVMRISRWPPAAETIIGQKTTGECNDARCAHEIKYKIAVAKAAFNKKTFYQQIGFNKFKEGTSKVVHLEHSSI